RNIVRDNMIAIPSGIVSHAMGVDKLIELQIGYIKKLIKARGHEKNWDRLGNITAAIACVQMIKKSMRNALSRQYAGSTHKTPDTSSLVWKVAKKVHKEAIDVTKANRVTVGKQKLVKDTLHPGHKKIRTKTLPAFNK
ncbi:hypothetical protein C8J56DRAFT_748917, partial [Mycena floridula]